MSCWSDAFRAHSFLPRLVAFPALSMGQLDAFWAVHQCMGGTRESPRGSRDPLCSASSRMLRLRREEQSKTCPGRGGMVLGRGWPLNKASFRLW